MKGLRDNSLTLVLLLIFAAALIGQALTGWSTTNGEMEAHGKALLGFGAYLRSGWFLSALFENWESEFLQMAAYVVLTAWLLQRGSANHATPTVTTARRRRRRRRRMT